MSIKSLTHAIKMDVIDTECLIGRNKLYLWIEVNELWKENRRNFTLNNLENKWNATKIKKKRRTN